nr:hypothetical protein [Bacilli bacterium]
MYTYGYTTVSAPKATSSLAAAGVWGIIAAILAIIGGILVYVLFLSKKNEKKFTGFVKWLYDFLSFKTLTLEMLLKVFYLITAIYLTLVSFAFIGTSALLFFGILILGNLFARVIYEGSLLVILIYKNTKEINEKK